MTKKAPPRPAPRKMAEEFYLRYYVGHRGKFGHEFMEFELYADGKLRYANNSMYKVAGESEKEGMIRKEVYLNQSVIDEFRRIIEESEVTKENDEKWPRPDSVGRQELEIKIGGEHISFICAKLGSLHDVNASGDLQTQNGMRVFYYLLQDLRCFVISLMALHFKIKPI